MKILISAPGIADRSVNGHWGRGEGKQDYLLPPHKMIGVTSDAGRLPEEGIYSTALDWTCWPCRAIIAKIVFSKATKPNLSPSPYTVKVITTESYGVEWKEILAKELWSMVYFIYFYLLN